MATYILHLSYPSYRMPRLLGSSKITVRHQVTLPEEAMKILKIKEGEVVAFVEENGKVIIRSEL